MLQGGYGYYYGGVRRLLRVQQEGVPQLGGGGREGRVGGEAVHKRLQDAESAGAASAGILRQVAEPAAEGGAVEGAVSDIY